MVISNRHAIFGIYSLCYIEAGSPTSSFFLKNLSLKNYPIWQKQCEGAPQYFDHF
jgi:hypothetical protein